MPKSALSSLPKFPHHSPHCPGTVYTVLMYRIGSICKVVREWSPYAVVPGTGIASSWCTGDTTIAGVIIPTSCTRCGRGSVCWPTLSSTSRLPSWTANNNSDRTGCYRAATYFCGFWGSDPTSSRCICIDSIFALFWNFTPIWVPRKQIFHPCWKGWPIYWDLSAGRDLYWRYVWTTPICQDQGKK